MKENERWKSVELITLITAAIISQGYDRQIFVVNVAHTLRSG